MIALLLGAEDEEVARFEIPRPHPMTKRLGWEINTTRGGHLRLTKPGHRAVFASSSPRGKEANLGQVRRDIERAEGRR